MAEAIRHGDGDGYVIGSQIKYFRWQGVSLAVTLSYAAAAATNTAVLDRKTNVLHQTNFNVETDFSRQAYSSIN